MEALTEAVLAIVLALAGYFLLSSISFNALLTGLRVDWLSRGCRLFFPLWPCPPRNMIVLTRLDGSVDIFYNAKIEPGQEGYIIRLQAEKILAKGLKPLWASLFAANYGPSSPFGIAIRALASAYYGLYFVFVAALFDGFGLFQDPLSKASLWAAFIFLLLYSLLSYQRMIQPQFPLYEIVEWEKKPEGSIALPSVGPRGIGPAEFARLAKLGLNIQVPAEVAELFNRIREELGRDDLAIASLLARAEEAERLKIEIRELARRQYYARQLARYMTLSEAARISGARILILLALSIAAFLAGFFAGGGWISITP